MQYVGLGHSGIQIPKVGLGAWQIGSSYWGWGREFDRESAIGVIRTALDAGMNFIDTAEAYGGGRSEDVIGEAVSDVRGEVVIATKVGPTHLTYRGVRKALEHSLERLRTKYVDLYQVHWPNPLIPMRGTMRAMGDLLEEGKIRAIGVSNFSLKRLERARQLLPEHDLASIQVEYNLLRRDAEIELIPYCMREGITLIAYSPIAQGLLTGKYGPGKMPKGLQRKIWMRFRYGRAEKLERLLQILKEISRNRGVTIPQVALNWVIRHHNVVAIPGAKREEHVKENAAAAECELSDEELKKIG